MYGSDLNGVGSTVRQWPVPGRRPWSPAGPKGEIEMTFDHDHGPPGEIRMTLSVRAVSARVVVVTSPQRSGELP
jgi:hypothetical protein